MSYLNDYCHTDERKRETETAGINSISRERERYTHCKFIKIFHKSCLCFNEKAKQNKFSGLPLLYFFLLSTENQVTLSSL